MRVLVTGASGMLGSTIVERWRPRHEVFATGGPRFTPPAAWTYRAFDLAGADHAPLIDWARPEAIVHCAALTAVDACETEPERALDLNGRSVERLVRAAPGVPILYISSDAVLGRFGDETAAPAPLNVYGRSKLLGERLLGTHGIAIRTTVVGWNRDPSKQSFVEWIARSVRSRAPVTLFDDARFTPIAASALADELEQLLAASYRGVLHVTGREAISKYDFGVRLCTCLGLEATSIVRGRLADGTFAAPRTGDQRLEVGLFERTFRRTLPTIADTIEALARGDQESRA